jgi:anti-sigma factor RsiW
MNCTHVRTQLPALLYGDLPPAAADALRGHLAGCAACREEYATLQRVRHTLDVLPAPAVQVDLPRLYREAAERQVRRAQRWRRVALAGCAAAAVLLLVAGLRLQVRLDARQLVVRWGAPDEPAAGPSRNQDTPPRDRPAAGAPDETEERLALISSLIHALAEDLEARDAQQQQAVKRLQDRLDALQFQGNARWGETERNIAALYAAQFGPIKKGE